MKDAETPQDVVLESREGAVAVLRLNNPAQLNALTLPMIGALKRAVERAIADPQVRAILLTGEVRFDLMAAGYALNLVYLVLGTLAFLHCFRIARRDGLLLQQGE